MNLSKDILLLQGPVGPFFDKLQVSLLERRLNCTRVLFNSGDRLFCRKKKNVINFEGNLEDWKEWFNNYLKLKSPNLVILFGADRPIHSIARKICEEFEIKVICLEEGYFRPGYISAEYGGNNANSPIAGQLPDLNKETIFEALDQEDIKLFSKNSFRNRCWYGFIYYFWSELASSSKERKLFHKDLKLCDQAIGWLKNFILWKIKRKQDEALFEKLFRQEYYLVALQLDADMQSRFQSNGWKKIDLIKEVIESLANSAISKSHLVFKVHPLERGHSEHKKIIRQIARNFGIEDRVWVIQTGSIGQWVKCAKGMITINSTAGFSAIFHGIPILLLGNAIYQHDRLVYKLRNKKDLDIFWSVKGSIDKTFRMHYLSWIKENSCFEGCFYTRLGNKKISYNIIKKFINS